MEINLGNSTKKLHNTSFCDFCVIYKSWNCSCCSLSWVQFIFIQFQYAPERHFRGNRMIKWNGNKSIQRNDDRFVPSAVKNNDGAELRIFRLLDDVIRIIWQKKNQCQFYRFLDCFYTFASCERYLILKILSCAFGQNSIDPISCVRAT